MTKPLICLSCIVGNEEAVIERFIRSFEPAVDFAVFVQAIGTQVPDKTMEIIGRVCEELDIPFVRQIYWNEKQWPHVDNFAKARQMAWNEAVKTKASFIMWADCDDILKEGAGEVLRRAADYADKDVYMAPYHVRGDKQISWRERLIKNEGFARWVKPIHEVLTFDRAVETRNLADAIIVHSPMQGRKSSAKRNFTILENEVQEGGANLFFLAQEAASLGDRDTYLRCAKAALAHPCTQTLDRYELYLILAQSEPLCEVAKGYATRAYDLMPDRREALALLVCYALIDGRNEEAHLMAKHMITIPKPRLGYYSLNHEWYDWKGFYLYTQTLRAVGKQEEALKLESEQFQKNGAIFTICHPTYKRPQQAAAVREMYLSTVRNPMAIEYIFGLHHDDQESLALLSGYRHTLTDKEGCCPNTLEPLRASKGKFVMVVADDLFPCDGWDELVVAALFKDIDVVDGKTVLVPSFNTKSVIAFNDSLRPDWQTHLCHAWMTRPYLEELLKDPWPGTGIFSDNEFSHRAKKARVVIECPQIVFDHRHYANGKAPIDATYRDQNQERNYKEGLKLLIERNPDYPPIEIKVTRAVEPIDIFPVLIEHYMQNHGRALDFLQIGAHDGKSSDAIYEFVTKECWKGVLVEPQPEMFKRLVANYEGQDQVRFENVAIADAPVVLYRFTASSNLPDHATMLASMNRDALVYNGFGYRGIIEEIKVPHMSFVDLIAKHKITHLDILQIDTEGFDFEILKMMAKTELRPAIIRFEHAMFGNTGDEARSFLAQLGYKCSAVGIDTIAVLEGKI